MQSLLSQFSARRTQRSALHVVTLNVTEMQFRVNWHCQEQNHAALIEFLFAIIEILERISNMRS